MREFSTELLFRPETEQLRFLPEGPYPYGPDRLSWVAIQHGASATSGSLNLFDFESGTNQSFDVPGRPGFAFPTNREGVFVTGMERRIGLFDMKTSSFKPLGDPVESDVRGTVINDAVVFSGGLIFGCKDLKFAEAKAGLYLWRRSDWRTIRLRNDQTCSNGKVVFGDGERVTLLDIDTPAKTVMRYEFDVTDGRLSPPEIVVDLRDRDVFPDGMIATPDGNGVIIAFYNPADAEFGEARQYSLSTGQAEAVWRTARSPRVTCPQLVERNGRIQLVLTTADEGMTPQQQAQHTNAGSLFIGETDFTSLPEQPLFEIPQ
ncbi:MAG: SMP-30/gluconolactonase/LRE family protein [Planctomycetota bacterium]|nr:SMP-30/gluconolactonase/LRE family protein [Planctomycetota bacterium]MDA1164560.1 SMP-30/gluconolactonase/LRE family protein [Planctomycetota bacterium]